MLVFITQGGWTEGSPNGVVDSVFVLVLVAFEFVKLCVFYISDL